VLLLGYREWGTELPEHLNGMWAFALYDAARDRLFCSRDRFGEKPFYYARTKDAFVFASDLTYIVRHPSVAKTVSPPHSAKYFA
jgi:asparagine synthase (glutamine-hydrolysing)